MASPMPTTIAPCAFTLDVQWILDAVQRVQDLLGRVRDICNTALNTARKILNKLSGILSWFCWMPAGKFAKKVVDAACRAIQNTVDNVTRIHQRVLEVMKHTLAPWEVRSAGRSIRDDLAPKCEQFAAMVDRQHLKSLRSWDGPASQAFFTTIDRQGDAARNVAEDARGFGESVHQIGADGVSTTVTFVSSLVAAIIGLITAIIGMIGVPVGTVAGAAAAIGLVGAILAFVMVFVTAMMAINRQVSDLSGAAGRVSGGQWPQATLA